MNIYAKASFDMEVLKRTYKLAALVGESFKSYLTAISFYKKLWDVAEEDQDQKTKLLAYQSMGKCYQLAKEYKDSIKCYKKVLEIAWDIEQVTDELNAYEAIGIQYYYLGKLDRAKYYHDRMIWGRRESKYSKIR